MDYTPYLRTARRRAQAERRAVIERKRRAWELARRAARLLRECYAAHRVVVFGSLVHEDRFTLWSDVDLVVWGIPWPDYLHALGEVLDLDPEIEVNIVDAASCRPAIKESYMFSAQDLEITNDPNERITRISRGGCMKGGKDDKVIYRGLSYQVMKAVFGSVEYTRIVN